MSTFDGSEIEEITFDGDQVSEVTMHGDVVWTAETVPTYTIGSVVETTDTSITVSFDVTDMGSFDEWYATTRYRRDGHLDWTTDSSYQTVNSTGSYQTTAGDANADAQLEPNTTYYVLVAAFKEPTLDTQMYSSNQLTQKTDEAVTAFDDFEWGGPVTDRYGSGFTNSITNWASIQTATSLGSGSYSLEGNKSSSQGARVVTNSVSGRAIAPGTTFSYLFRLGSGMTFGGAFQFGHDDWTLSDDQTSLSGYQARVRTDLNDGRFQLYRSDSGSLTFLDETQAPNISTGTTYRVEIDYPSGSGSINGRIYSYPGDSLLGSWSASDTTYRGDNWSWFLIQSDATLEWWDELKEVE